MTVSRYRALSAYWTEHPPLHLLAAAYLGYRSGKGGQDGFGAFFADMTGCPPPE